jgi:hypothetical protein
MQLQLRCYQLLANRWPLRAAAVQTALTLIRCTINCMCHLATE